MVFNSFVTFSWIKQSVIDKERKGDYLGKTVQVCFSNYFYSKLAMMYKALKLSITPC